MTDLTFYNLEDRRWPNERLKRAAIVGHTTATTARIWVRTRDEGTYWLAVNPGPIPVKDTTPSIGTADGGGPALRIDGGAPLPAQLYEGQTRNANDRTAVFDVAGLEGGVTYHYALVRTADADGNEVDHAWELGRGGDFSFTTQDPNAKDVAFGLYSCHMPYNKLNLNNMDMWRLLDETLEDAGADFMIGGGDQVYTDGNPEVSIWNWLKKNKDAVAAMTPGERHDTMVSWYRDIYRGYWGPLALRKVMRKYPTYMMWDDHEIMDGWGSYTDDERSNQLDSLWEWENKEQNLKLANAMFDAAKQVYGEYQHAHNPDTPDGRWDYTFDWAGCAFFVMDMRGQRDFNRNENRILGADQLADFLAWLDSDRVKNAKAVFIVSPVPVVHISEFIVNTFDLPLIGYADDFRDEWDHKSNWDERDKVLNAVFKFSRDNAGKTVAFLSGDVHIGAAFRLTQPARSDANVYQLTSSAITYFLSDVTRNVLEWVVRENGTLNYTKDKPVRDNEKVSFKCLHTFKRNNFGIIRVKDRGADKPSVTWDLYGNSGEHGQLLKERRVTLG